MTVIRWRITEPVSTDAAIVQINPNKMDAPTTARTMTFAWGEKWGLDIMRGIDRPTPPRSWTFGGVLLTEAHYNLLLTWTKRLQVVHITDHLGRTFKVVIQKFDPVERLPTATKPWRADYTMTCLLLGEVA